MKELLFRLSQPTPKLFKVLRNLGLTLAALATCFITMKSQGVPLPDWLSHVLNWYTLSGGTIAAFISQLTTVWSAPQMASKKLKETDSLKEEHPVYPQFTYEGRIKLDTKVLGEDYIVFQIDSKPEFPHGYYIVSATFTWDYIGGRPPHR